MEGLLYPTQTDVTTTGLMAPATTPHLTARERDLVRALARGLTNLQIAEEFHLSQQTVKNQLTTVYQKMGLRSRLQLAVYAMKNDLA